MKMNSAEFFEKCKGAIESLKFGISIENKYEEARSAVDDVQGSVCLDDYVCIDMFKTEVETIVGKREGIEFYVYYITYDPGTRWEPPSNDYIDVGTYKHIVEALSAAIGVVASNRIDGYMESLIEDF